MNKFIESDEKFNEIYYATLDNQKIISDCTPIIFESPKRWLEISKIITYISKHQQNINYYYINIYYQYGKKDSKICRHRRTGFSTTGIEGNIDNYIRQKIDDEISKLKHSIL